jgi:uncharacterized protein YbdZ (MbtH family)
LWQERSAGLVSINLFDDDNGKFLFLVDDEEQHSLWSAFATFQPAGKSFSAKGAACPDPIEQNRTNIWPKSLRERLVQGRGDDI